MNAIVLTSTRYADDRYMVNLFTDELGYVSVAVKIGRRSKVRQIHLQPLSLLTVQLSGKPSQHVMNITECAVAKNVQPVTDDPIKQITLQFLAEFLHHTLYSLQSDASLFDFISSSVRQYAELERGKANFHLVFLLKLTHYLGLFPNLENYQMGAVFDLQDGCFTVRLPLHNFYLSVDETITFIQLLRADYTTAYLYDFTRAQRNSILDHILLYYRLHSNSFGDLKSLDVFRSLI